MQNCLTTTQKCKIEESINLGGRSAASLVAFVESNPNSFSSSSLSSFLVVVVYFRFARCRNRDYLSDSLISLMEHSTEGLPKTLFSTDFDPKTRKQQKSDAKQQKKNRPTETAKFDSQLTTLTDEVSDVV